MSRANDSGVLVEDAQSWRKASIPLASKAMIRTLFWQWVQGGVKRQGGLEIWRKVFYELDDFLDWYVSAMKKYPRLVEKVGGQSVVTFVCPYGYVNETVSEISMAECKNFFKENKMTNLFFSCKIEGGAEISATGTVAKSFRVFVLERKEGKINGENRIFYKVFHQNEINRPAASITIMNGVVLKGVVGWIPAKSLTQAYCRCPAISFKADDNEAHPFTYIFKPHQAKSGVLQWRIAATPLEMNGFPLPDNFVVWAGDLASLSIDDGEMEDYDVMFKCEGGWYHVRVLRFYPDSKRSNKFPFNYEVMFMDGSRDKMDIQFHVDKYDTDEDAPVSSWCIITEE